MTFDLIALRFRFRALGGLHFPPGRAGNTLRGALGLAFRKIASGPDCPYARFFEPVAKGAGPSGLTDWPRPFVIRANALDGRAVPPGECFEFDVHLFDLRDKAPPDFVRGFEQLSRDGLGPARAAVELVSVEQNGPISLSFAPEGPLVRRLALRFLSPTEIKADGPIIKRPEFDVLFARIRDRISTLRALYGPGPLPVDFRGIGERARRITLTRCDLNWHSSERRSSKTGQRHRLGGFTGEAEYEGDLTEFVPYLKIASWTGVGRQTSWGKGHVEILYVIPPRPCASAVKFTSSSSPRNTKPASSPTFDAAFRPE